jgi:phosphoglycolate phosphatase
VPRAMVMALGTKIKVRAIAFDLDGTLLDTIHDLAAAINVTLERIGEAQLPKETVRSMVGKGIPNLIRRTLTASRGTEPDAAEEARALAIYEQVYEKILGRETKLFPGVLEGLERLATAGFGMACITNKSNRFTAPHLEKAGIANYFSLVLGGDSLPAKKPDPLPLRHVAKHFGVAPERLLMLGDSANDTQAARSAGCPILCVSYGYAEGRPVQSLDCDGIVSSLDELPGLLRYS